MKKIFYKKWMKAVAAVLCIISFHIAAGSLFGIVIGDSYGVYESSREEFKQRMYDSICMDYSISAVVAYENDFNMEALKDTNFRYGVIQTDDITGLNLNDKKIYEVCNFDQRVTEDMLYIHSYSIGEETDFCVGKSLFDHFYIYNDSSYREKRSTVEKCYYARDTERFYCLSEGKLYPVENYNYNYDGIFCSLIPVETSDKTIEYMWEDGQEQIQLDGMTWYLSDIPVLLRTELDEIGTVISDQSGDPAYEDYSIQNGSIVTYMNMIPDTTPYYVLSYVHEPLKAEEGFFYQNIFGKLERWEKQDFFVQAETLMDIMYTFRHILFVIFVLSLILCVVSFAGLMTGAGHHNTEEVTPDWLSRIPYDVFIVMIIAIGTIPAAIVAEAGVTVGITVAVGFGILAICLEEVLVILFCMSTAVRIKLGGWWKNTLCYRLARRIKGWIFHILDIIGKSLPMLWKAWVIMGALAFLELIGVVSTSYNPGVQVFLWFVEKIILYSLITIVLLQMRKLQKAGKELAEGGLESHLDTSRMMWDFKEHGDNLNHIQDGIQKAVAEQLKSERFKTELITNVSHDIKTPLTSIINYVDLMGKEEIDNPSVQEYLEVLSRQSGRLKKLIEDLMEASKASTGNLPVVYESCDVHVMLIQTIGEFEEKLKANQIDLIVQGNDNPFIIQADPRHLWRIFENLMNNICKYAQPATRAYVNIEQSEQSGRIIFRNISKYALNIEADELMERFVRGDSSRNTEGSGLGLSIAKSLTELMQGTFELIVDGDLFKVIITFTVTEKN